MVAVAFWMISGFAFAYFPVLIQRRFILGITIPLGILSIYGLSHLIEYIARRSPSILNREGLLYFTYILFASISSIYLVLGLSLYMQSHPTDKFYPRDLENAFTWLNKNAASNDFVLADVKTSQLVAQRTNLRVYVGHEMETINFEAKKSSMEAYYKGELSENWLAKTRAKWVVYGPYEKDISSSFAPGLGLEMVYKNGSVIIYKSVR
jgi:hypothetical protein